MSTDHNARDTGRPEPHAHAQEVTPPESAALYDDKGRPTVALLESRVRRARRQRDDARVEVCRLAAALAEAEAAWDEAVAGYDAQVRHGRAHFERAERAEAALRDAEQVFRGVEALPSTYTRAPGLNGDRVADLLSSDCYRLGAEGRAILSAALDRAGAGRASAAVPGLRPVTGGHRAQGDDGAADGDEVGGDGKGGEQVLDHGGDLSGAPSTSAVAP